MTLGDQLIQFAAMVEDGGLPVPEALSRCNLKPADLLGAMDYMTQTERIGDTGTELLLVWFTTTGDEAVRYESDHGHFAEAGKVREIHRRVGKELTDRGIPVQYITLEKPGQSDITALPKGLNMHYEPWLEDV